MVKQEDLVKLEKRLTDYITERTQNVDNFAYENHKINSEDIDEITVSILGGTSNEE